jgi:adhesin transport system outer membrane protein
MKFVFSFFVFLLFPVCVLAAENWPSVPEPGKALSVNDTVYGVLRTHRALRGMQENRAVLESELSRARRSGYGPRVDVSGQLGAGILSDPTTRANDTDHMRGVTGASATLTQPLVNPGAWSRVDEAGETLSSVRWRTQDTAASVALDGVLAHIDLLRRRSIYDFSVKNVENIKAILLQAEERASMGVDTRADVSQARSRLSRAMSTLAEAKAALIVAEDAYIRLTGLPPSSLEQVGPPAREYQGTDEVFTLAEKKNPRLAAYLSEVRVRRAAHDTARSAYLPVFNFEAGPNYSNRGRNGDENYTSSFDMLGVMRWNLFNSGADAAASEAAAARIRQSRQDLMDYRDELKLEIESAWINMKSAHEQFGHYSQAVEHNTYTRQAYWQQFQVGGRSLLDVLDSENELYSSTIQAESARASEQANTYRLSTLAGELFEILQVDLEPLGKLPPEEQPLPGEEKEE